MKAAVVAILLASSSCSLFGPTVVCDETNLGGEMTCAQVLSLARAQLAGVSGITTLTAVPGNPCRVDSLSCGPDVSHIVTTVYADLSDGRQLAVRIFAADGGESLQADPPIDMESMR